MSMEDFYCDVFDLSFSLTVEDFDKDVFLKEAGIENESDYTDEDGDLAVALAFSSREEPPKQHAHFRIVFRHDNTVRAALNFHQAGTRQVEKKPPYLEDCAEWLSRFFKSDEVPADIHIVYDFDENFTTTIPLPFPLVASNKALAGLKVTGLSFEYPKGAMVESAIVQSAEDGVFLFFEREAIIRLKEFNLYKELEKLTASVNTLVKRGETTNGGSQQKAEAQS